MPRENLIGTEAKCECGCGETFIVNSVQHIYFNGAKCRNRDIRNKINSGDILPIDHNLCEICSELIPVYAQYPASARRRTCCNECKKQWVVIKKFETVGSDSLIKPFRQDYCRQDGECERYGPDCSAKGPKHLWPRELGEECFKKIYKPVEAYDKRTAIQMVPHKTSEKGCDDG